MALTALNQSDLAVIGRALQALAAGDIIEEFEFGARIGVELTDFREMLAQWPAWDDADDKSAECLVINNTLNDLFHGVGLSETATALRCSELAETSCFGYTALGLIHAVGVL